MRRSSFRLRTRPPTHRPASPHTPTRGVVAGVGRTLRHRRAAARNPGGPAASVAGAQGAGCRRACVDGSFVTSKEVPRDFDGCWDHEGVDFDALDPVLLDFEGHREAQKAKFEGEMFLSMTQADALGRRFLDFFRLDRCCRATSASTSSAAASADWVRRRLTHKPTGGTRLARPRLFAGQDNPARRPRQFATQRGANSLVLPRIHRPTRLGHADAVCASATLSR
jgi:hypothetical protein